MNQESMAKLGSWRMLSGGQWSLRTEERVGHVWEVPGASGVKYGADVRYLDEDRREGEGLRVRIYSARVNFDTLKEAIDWVNTVNMRSRDVVLG